MRGLTPQLISDCVRVVVVRASICLCLYLRIYLSVYLFVGAGLVNPFASYALRLQLDCTYLPKHPYLREYEILAELPHHQNVTRIWSKFEEEEVVMKLMQPMPEFILTMFDDKLQVDKDWRPKVV